LGRAADPGCRIGAPGCGQKAASKFSDAQKVFILKHCNDGVPVAKILKRNGRHAMTVSVSMPELLCDVGHTPDDKLVLDCRMFIGEPREEVVAP